ncbi:capsule assembly Wzi family protein, partial [bacterium]|nr:capsule assembly Wzi family protein [bacterium]
TCSDIGMLSTTLPFISTRHWVEPDCENEGREYKRFESEGYLRNRLFNDIRCGEVSGLGWCRIHNFLQPIPMLDRLYSDSFHFGTLYIGRQFVATFQPVYGIERIDTDDERDPITRITTGFRVEGAYKTRKDDHFYYMVDFRDHAESGNGPYDSRERLYEDRWAAVDTKGKSETSYDISESLIQYYGKDLAITAGRGRHQWGPAQYGGLFLNGYAPPFDYVRFDGIFERRDNPWALYYTFLHGFLESTTPAETLYTLPDGRARTINSQKYISAQRVEIRPAANVIFGFSQGVIYGDRGLQLSYLTPLNWLYSVQHSNDDKDNLLLAADFKWRPIAGLKLYGELLMDDVVVGDLFKSTGNNKSAYTVGMHGIVPRPFWEKFDGRVEYTKIRPFVYTHFFETNTYSHWTSPLGYTREPNSEFITTEVRGTFYPVQVTLHYSRQNHGANYYTHDGSFVNVGGDINIPGFEGNDQEYPFLAGEFERTTRKGVRVTWEVLPGLILYASGTQIEESRSKNRFETQAGFGWNL